MPGRDIVARTWPNDYIIMRHPEMLHGNLTIFKFEPTTPNMLQHVAPDNVAICCAEMLRSFGRGYFISGALLYFQSRCA